jgi:hypothetical protein
MLLPRAELPLSEPEQESPLPPSDPESAAMEALPGEPAVVEPEPEFEPAPEPEPPTADAQASVSPEPEAEAVPSKVAAPDGPAPSRPTIVGHAAATRALWRRGCAWLELHRTCRHARCRRARGCRGNPVTCLPAGVRLAPQPVRTYVRLMMEAQDLGLTVEEAMENAADYEDAYAAWIAGLAAARRER